MAMSQDPGRGQTILIMGIVGLVCCAFAAPLAWIWGKQDMAKIQAGEISREAESQTKIGMILGIIGTIWLVVQLIGGCIWVIVVVAFGTALSKAVPTTRTALDVVEFFANCM